MWGDAAPGTVEELLVSILLIMVSLRLVDNG